MIRFDYHWCATSTPLRTYKGVHARQKRQDIVCRRLGGSVGDEWSGDLRRMSWRVWREESDVAAIVVVQGDEACGWYNLKHVHAAEARNVWMWARHAARFRPPCDVLYAEDLAVLTGGDQQVKEA